MPQKTIGGIPVPKQGALGVSDGMIKGQKRKASGGTGKGKDGKAGRKPKKERDLMDRKGKGWGFKGRSIVGGV